MWFLLQKDGIEDNVDIIALRNELKMQKMVHRYAEVPYCELSDAVRRIKTDAAATSLPPVPVGTIEYVQEYLRLMYGIDHMNPIEVPKELRKERYLKRQYSIEPKEKMLKRSGKWFIKDVSRLKGINYIGNIESLKEMEEKGQIFLPNGLYACSEIKDILAEYRIFIISEGDYDDQIYGIQFYDGDPAVMPSPQEIQKIKEMVANYSLNRTRPKAYSLDVAVIEENGERDLMILEVHPFTALGLYGLSGGYLPYAYRDGVDWYVQQNTPLEEWHTADEKD